MFNLASCSIHICSLLQTYNPVHYLMIINWKQQNLFAIQHHWWSVMPIDSLGAISNSGILPSGHLLADSKSCYKLRRGFGVLACPIGRLKKNLSPNKAHEQYMLFSYWKYYFGQIPIDSTSAGVEEEVICRWWWWNLCCVLWMRR